MKNLVIVSFPAKPETLEKLKESMRRALPDTRNFEGCLSVNTFIEESTNTIHLIEDWNHSIIKQLILTGELKMVYLLI